MARILSVAAHVGLWYLGGVVACCVCRSRLR